MKYILILLLFTLSLFAKPKEVLLLHSYHKGYIWTNEISNAIEKNFLPHDDIELTTLYMDTKRVNSVDYIEALAKLYKKQFENRKFDLIIASDNAAFSFMIRYHETLFTDIPVLFCGINNFDKAFLGENDMYKYMSGVVEQVDVEKNFELMSKLQPNLKNLLIINDTSTTGHAVRRELRAVIDKYKHKFNIEYVDNLEIERLKKHIKKLDKKDSAILFVLLFRDRAGKYFTYKQSFRQIRKISEVPIYGLWDFYLNYGLVGGLLTSATAQGDAVSKMAIDILLHGKKINDIPILENSPNKYMFNYEELKRFNLDVDRYVDNYVLINEPKTLYREYREFLVFTIIVIIILVIIVIIMRGNIKRRIVVERDLLNRIEFDKVLLDTIPNPIFYKNIDGKFIGCNIAFSNLVEVSKKDVIGKTAFDFFPTNIAIKNTNIDKQLLETLGTNTSEMAVSLNNKSMKYFILNKAVYKDMDGSIGGIVCIMDNITVRVQQKQFLIQQSKLAEMGDMVAAIAHQWNEPLVELSAQVQDIQTSYLLNELKDAQVEEFVKDSMVQIKYMSRTLSDFRNFLKPSTKKAFFPIKKALDDVNEILGKQIFYSNIDMKFVYKNVEEALLIYGYENEFKQVLLNLINNAKNKIIESMHMKDSRGNITIIISKCENYYIIEIVDDGGEIDKKIIKSIFEPYFTTKKDGTGLGLYMAKVIIEDKMQGFIDVKNSGKDEVTFTIKLPKRRSKNENFTTRR